MMVQYQGAKASGNEIILIIAFIFGLIIVLYMLAKRELGAIAEGFKLPDVKLPNISIFGEKTDKQTTQEIVQEKYNMNYLEEFTPQMKAEYEKNLGVTKSYYETYHTPMTWGAFQAALPITPDGKADVSYGAGFTGVTTILRSEVPADYTGTYWAGKRII